MSGIGGPGGIGGPKGPRGIDPSGGTEEIDEAGDVGETERAAAGELDRIAADVASGKLTAQQAIDRMVDQMASTEHLGAEERAELRELLADLVANDPYLSGLLGRV